jgi:hypothetical protein
MYELGAVTALQAMGFSASSRRVEDLRQKTEVKKAAGDIVFEITDQEITDVIENRIIVQGTATSEAVIQDARRQIRDRVYLGAESTQDVAQALKTTEGFPLWYANRISRTEAQQAYQLGMYNTFQRSGVKKHAWVTVGDDRVRPEHTDNEAAGPIKVGAFFPSGEQYPGQSSPNCRCTLQPDLSDPKLVLEPWDGSSGPYPIGPDSRPTAPIPKPPRLPKPLKPPELTELQRSELRAAEDLASRQGMKEKAFTFDMKTGLQELEIEGDATSITFKSSDLVNSNGLLLMHSHPETSSFSVEDWFLFSKRKDVRRFTVEAKNASYVLEKKPGADKIFSGSKATRGGRELPDVIMQQELDKITESQKLFKSEMMQLNRRLIQEGRTLEERTEILFEWRYHEANKKVATVYSDALTYRKVENASDLRRFGIEGVPKRVEKIPTGTRAAGRGAKATGEGGVIPKPLKPPAKEVVRAVEETAESVVDDFAGRVTAMEERIGAHQANQLTFGEIDEFVDELAKLPAQTQKDVFLRDYERRFGEPYRFKLKSGKEAREEIRLTLTRRLESAQRGEAIDEMQGIVSKPVPKQAVKPPATPKPVPRPPVAKPKPPAAKPKPKPAPKPKAKPKPRKPAKVEPLSAADCRL